MLEEKHLSILGGEVDSLLETNNYKNVLKRKIEHSNSSAPLCKFLILQTHLTFSI